MKTTRTQGIEVEELDRCDTEDLEAAPPPDELPHPYTAALAAKVHHVLLSVWWEVPVSQNDVADILSEAFHQIFRDIRAGRVVDIEDIGRFHRIGLEKPWIIYRANPLLMSDGGAS